MLTELIIGALITQFVAIIFLLMRTAVIKREQRLQDSLTKEEHKDLCHIHSLEYDKKLLEFKMEIQSGFNKLERLIKNGGHGDK